MNRLKLFLFVALIACSCTRPTFRTFDKFITYDQERIDLSLKYLNERHGIDTDSVIIEPKMVVLHWTVIPDVERTFEAFNSSKLPSSRENITSASSLNVSSQYLVDRDGTIFKLMPENYFARHTIGLNHCAIGIENIGSAEEPPTASQLEANEQIIRYLKEKYDITHVIGHYEYKLFQHHPYWKETDPDYLTDKDDPGEAFMKAIRKQIKDMDIKGVEEFVK